MSSATLTWFHSGPATKTGTTVGAMFTDMLAMFNAEAANADFSWEVAASNVGSTPYYINLKRKNGAPGRVLFILWTTAPGGGNLNPAYLDTNPSINYLYAAFFPNGNVDAPSNLNSSAGAIMGNDSGSVKCVISAPLANMYAASFAPFYFDCADGIVVGTQNPGAAPGYLIGAGYLVVDQNDDARPCAVGSGSGTYNNFASGAFLNFVAAGVSAGALDACVRSNYPAANATHFRAFSTAGAWASQAIGANDVLTDTAEEKAWFVPVPLIAAQVKGGGFALKLRQIGWGPGTTGPFTPYSTSGPVVAARQFNAATAGGNGYPWFTNFKI